MLFSLDFVLLYLPIILVVFFVLRKISPSICPVYFVLLLYVALLFIDFTSFLLVFSTSSLNYWLVKRVAQHNNSRFLVGVGVVISLIPLVFFKFASPVLFDVRSESSIFFTVGIPMGLSFYALQQISALLDCRKGDCPTMTYPRHLLYLGFFPNFLAGPVFPYRDAVGQIGILGKKTIPDDWLGNGLLLFFFGLAKKLWIADPIGGLIDHIYTEVNVSDVSLNIFEAWFVVWGFLVQLYFDFSAYSDMAIGLALCFGILLPVNFDSPLKSFSTQEYISRWHMSFTNFVRVYFFIPALGVLKRLPIQNTEKRMAVSWASGLFLSYMIIGVWHSPNITIMLSTTIVIFVVFVLKLPGILSGKVVGSSSSSRLRKHINRVLILVFSMLMASSLKIQDVDIILKVYSSLLDFKNVALPGYLQDVLPDFMGDIVSYTGIAPTMDNYSATTAIFRNKKYYVLLLLVSSIMIFCSPNSMQIFEIKNADDKSLFKNGKGLRFYVTFLVLFSLVVFSLLFENHYASHFIYEYF